MSKEKQQVRRIITPEFRVSWPSVFEARKVNENDPNEKPKFSIVMLFRVKETEKSKELGEKPVDLTELRQAVAACFAEHLGSSWQEEIKKRKGDGSPMYRSPFRRGDDPEKADKDGFGPGVIYARASSLYKPGVVDWNKQDIINPREFMGGMYARAQISVLWYSVKGNKGVSFGLDNVQKIRDGEIFGGGQKAQDAFDAIEPPEGAGVAVEAGASAGAGEVSTSSDPLMG